MKKTILAIAAFGTLAMAGNQRMCNYYAGKGIEYGQRVQMKAKNGIDYSVDLTMARDYMINAIAACRRVGKKETTELADTIERTLKDYEVYK